MHITLEADYAIRIVHSLAQSGKRCDAKTLSEKTGVTLRFALKILRKLVAAELVKSFKGTLGGYELARPAAEISLKEVIETVEGPYALSRCLGNNFQCSNPEGGPCKYCQVFAEISEMVNEKLASVNFAEMLDE